MLTETWFSKGNKKVAHELKVLDQRDDIKFLRRDRDTRGGGVAIAFDSKLVTSSWNRKRLPVWRFWTSEKYSRSRDERGELDRGSTRKLE